MLSKQLYIDLITETQQCDLFSVYYFQQSINSTANNAICMFQLIQQQTMQYACFNLPLLLNNYSNTGYSCHIRKYTFFKKKFASRKLKIFQLKWCRVSGP